MGKRDKAVMLAQGCLDAVGLFRALGACQRIMTELYLSGDIQSPNDMKVCLYAYFGALKVDLDGTIENVGVKWSDNTKAVGEALPSRAWRKALELYDEDVIVTISTALVHRRYKTVSFHMPTAEYEELIVKALNGRSMADWMRDAVRLKVESEQASST